MGQVLHGGLAGQAGDDLDHRRGGVRRSIGAAFTGYLSQQNFASQWIASEGKDGLNSVGIGAFFNVLNFGQMFMWHILLLPIGMGALIVVHVLLVRKQASFLRTRRGAIRVRRRLRTRPASPAGGGGAS